MKVSRNIKSIEELFPFYQEVIEEKFKLAASSVQKQKIRKFSLMLLGFIAVCLGILTMLPASSLIFLAIGMLLYVFIFGKKLSEDDPMKGFSEYLIKSLIRFSGFPFQYNSHRHIPIRDLKDSGLILPVPDQIAGDFLASLKEPGQNTISFSLIDGEVISLDDADKEVRESAFKGVFFTIALEDFKNEDWLILPAGMDKLLISLQNEGYQLTSLGMQNPFGPNYRLLSKEGRPNNNASELIKGFIDLQENKKGGHPLLSMRFNRLYLAIPFSENVALNGFFSLKPNYAYAESLYRFLKLGIDLSNSYPS